MKKTTIGLSMIVRDEESNLARCLDSVRGLVDEIVVVDTGSRDRTVEVARRYTDRVFSFPWSGDFSAARNYALDKTHSRWVFYLDADEELDASCGDIRSLVDGSGDIDAFFLPLYNQDEISGNYSRYLVLRLFRNSPGHRFQGRIHEQLTVTRPGSVSIAGSPVINHRATSGKGRNRKRGRNLQLLRQAVSEDPDNPFLQYYLGIEWLGLGRPQLALPCIEKACRDLTDHHLAFRVPAVGYLVNCLHYMGRLQEAFCICMEESLRYPSYPDIFFKGGLILEEMGEYQAAARWFGEACACGPPPLLYSHTMGTESFLALHHLGNCHEKMGMVGEAIDYYNRALESDPGYVYPLYNLFLIRLSRLGPHGAFRRALDEGHLNDIRRAEALAELFFEAGYPGLACACLEESPPEDGFTGSNQLALQLARYRVYSGRAEEALSLMESAGRDWREFEPALAADEVAALLLAGNCSGARKRALELWRQPERRGAAWGLLNLVSLYCEGSWAGRPEKHREDESIEAVLPVLDKCLLPRTPAKNSGRTEDFGRLAQSAARLLVRLSPRGASALWNYLGNRGGAVRGAMDARFSPAGGLYR
ncbi:MAG: glycosyltransferase [Bacillota bacterium]